MGPPTIETGLLDCITGDGNIEDPVVGVLAAAGVDEVAESGVSVGVTVGFEGPATFRPGRMYLLDGL